MSAVNRIFLALLLLWSLIGAPYVALAQSQELMKAFEQSKALIAAGKYAAAEPYAHKALALGEIELGRNHPDVAKSLNNLAELYQHLGRNNEAEPLYKRSLAIWQTSYGPNHPYFAKVLDNLGSLYFVQHRYAEAELLHKRSLSILENSFGSDHPDVSNPLNNLATVYYMQGRYEEAERLFRRAVTISEQSHGLDHPEIAGILYNLGMLYKKQGRIDDAELSFKRSLTIQEKAHGPDHPKVATALGNLGLLYLKETQFDKAELLYKRILTIREKESGSDNLSYAAALSDLGMLYNVQTRFDEAEPLLSRALAIREKVLEPDHILISVSLKYLATTFEYQRRYGEAESLYKRSLEIREKSLPPGHQDVSESIVSLARHYESQGLLVEAEPLYKRYLTNIEKALGSEHPSVAKSILDLAQIYVNLGRYGEAELFTRRALEINEKVLEPSHPNIATSLDKLATIYKAVGRYDEAEQLYKRSLEIREVTPTPDLLSVAGSVYNLAKLYLDQGRHDDAEPLYKRALENPVKVISSDALRAKILGDLGVTLKAKILGDLGILYAAKGRYSEAETSYKRSLKLFEQSHGPDHPNVASALGNLAAFQFTHHRKYNESILLHLKALAIEEKALGADHLHVANSLSRLASVYWSADHNQLASDSFRRATAIFQKTANQSMLLRSSLGHGVTPRMRTHLYNHLTFTIGGSDDTSERNARVDEGFEVGQLINNGSPSVAISRMAMRFAAGDDGLANIVRDRQDAVDQLRKVDATLLKVLSQPQGERGRISKSSLRQKISALNNKIEEIDKRLTTTFPQFAELSSPKPVSLIEVQELLTEDEALLIYLAWNEISFVFAVRRDRVMVEWIKLSSEELEVAVTELRRPLAPDYIQSLSDIPTFNTTRAFELYQRLFRPVEDILEGARHVFVVPDGALQSLPLGVLVTEKPADEASGYNHYRQTKWLAKKYAMTTLPSVSSLRALRTFAKRAKASRPFLGIGDPKLRGKTGSGRGMKLASLFTPRGTADVNSVRQLPSLPDTAVELRSMARILGAGDGALILGTAATETRIKQTSLKDYKVLAFATHGLLAGDIANLAEPALVLTPPAEGSEQDDGLLMASEVAQLKLDADWVILSACNTAAADGTPGAEGLSGLAKAFFYAGSRALLVSHWPVASDAAVQITTRMLAEAGKPGVGRSEAHRRAMMSMIDDKEHPHYAHPFFWAPFVVVGEGGLPNWR